MEIVRLAYGEISVASHVATMRHTNNMLRGRPPRYGASHHDSFELHIRGCCAELALAKYLNLFWCLSLNDMSERDVGDLIDVRSGSQSGYRLILHPDDSGDVPFVNAWVILPEVHLVGWMFARDGKRDEWWQDPVGGRPAFFVPNDALVPMSELKWWVSFNARCEHLDDEVAA